MTRNITCISCPMGCLLTVETEEGAILSVTGHSCPRGPKYAREEISNPARTVTSTVRLKNGEMGSLPVKTARPVPKGKIANVVQALQGIEAIAPIRLGQVIIPDVCGTGVPVVATCCVDSLFSDR